MRRVSVQRVDFFGQVARVVVLFGGRACEGVGKPHPRLVVIVVIVVVVVVVVAVVVLLLLRLLLLLIV